MLNHFSLNNSVLLVFFYIIISVNKALVSLQTFFFIRAYNSVFDGIINTTYIVTM